MNLGSFQDQMKVKDLMDQIKDHQNVQALIRAYQIRGHWLARLDPLDISNQSLSEMPPELNIKNYFPADSDMDKIFQLPSTTFIGDKQHETALPLKEIVRRLEKTYCGSIGVEYMFINSRAKCNYSGCGLVIMGAAWFGKVMKPYQCVKGVFGISVYMYGICMVYVYGIWYMYGICIWYMYGICIWYMYGICIWYMYGICIWYMYMVYVWYMYGICIWYMYMVYVYGICMVYLQCIWYLGDWIRQRFEAPGCFSMSSDQKRTLLARLVRSTRFVN